MRFLLVLLAACGTAGTGAHGGEGPRRNTEGLIMGLCRDGDSAEPLGAADVKAQGPNPHDVAGVSGRDGVYTLDHLAPGSYTVIGNYAGQTITITNVAVDPGEATYVDLPFTPGRPVPYTIDYTDPELSTIRTFHPKDGGTSLVGMVSDSRTHGRIPGAVVTAFGPAGAYADTTQVVSGDDGRYTFGAVAPGVYVVSAYYSVGGRGQIEVRRSDIHVETGTMVEVPLFIETTRRN